MSDGLEILCHRIIIQHIQYELAFNDTRTKYLTNRCHIIELFIQLESEIEQKRTQNVHKLQTNMQNN